MNILVLAAHPDDEVLGLGGTIARHISQQDNAIVMHFTDGLSAREGVTNETMRKRREEATNAMDTLGFMRIAHSFPDEELDIVPLKSLAKVMHVEPVPDIVYVHYNRDINQDHRRIYEAAMIAFRPRPETCTNIYAYRVPSYGNPTLGPNHYVVLADTHVNKACAALQCYESELNDRLSTQTLRRTMSEHGSSIGTKYADAFEVIRQIT